MRPLQMGPTWTLLFSIHCRANVVRQWIACHQPFLAKCGLNTTNTGTRIRRCTSVLVCMKNDPQLHVTKSEGYRTGGMYVLKMWMCVSAPDNRQLHWPQRSDMPVALRLQSFYMSRFGYRAQQQGLISLGASGVCFRNRQSRNLQARRGGALRGPEPLAVPARPNPMSKGGLTACTSLPTCLMGPRLRYGKFIRYHHMHMLQPSPSRRCARANVLGIAKLLTPSNVYVFRAGIQAHW